MDMYRTSGFVSGEGYAAEPCEATTIPPEPKEGCPIARSRTAERARPPEPAPDDRHHQPLRRGVASAVRLGGFAGEAAIARRLAAGAGVGPTALKSEFQLGASNSCLLRVLTGLRRKPLMYLVSPVGIEPTTL